MVETDQTSAETAPCLALSIVIPVFNGAESVAELIGALEKLRIPGGHEIVLVNDGSVDNSLQVLHALFEKAACQRGTDKTRTTGNNHARTRKDLKARIGTRTHHFSRPRAGSCPKGVV